MKRCNLGLVYLAIVILVALLASCSVAKVYEKGGTWSKHSSKSEVTGWTYSKK